MLSLVLFSDFVPSEGSGSIVLKARVVRNVEGLDLVVYNKAVGEFNEYFYGNKTEARP